VKLGTNISDVSGHCWKIFKSKGFHDKTN